MGAFSWGVELGAQPPPPHWPDSAGTFALPASSPVCLEEATMLSAVRQGEDGELRKNPCELAARDLGWVGELTAPP